MSGVYRRHRERAGSGWGVWLFASGVVAVIAATGLAVFLVRAKTGDNPSGGLVVAPQKAVADAAVVPPQRAGAGDMTERELAELLKSKGVKVVYGGSGMLLDPHYGSPAEAELMGHVSFRKCASDEAARQSAGATREGFCWGKWCFVPHVFEANYKGDLVPAIKKALGLAPTAEDIKAEADATRLAGLILRIASQCEQHELLMEKKGEANEEKAKECRRKIAEDALEVDAILARHPGWSMSDPKPTERTRKAASAIQRFMNDIR